MSQPIPDPKEDPMRVQRYLFPTGVLTLAVLLAFRPLAAAEPPSGRLRVSPDSSEQADVKACLNTVAEAACAEDLDGFADCFTKSSRAKIRKQAATRFVQYAVAMEVLDAQVIKLAGNSGQAAVRYRLALSDDQYDVVSLVALKREHGYWKIHSEKVQTFEYQSPSCCSPSRYQCFGSECRLAAR
ncbi:MAG: hypothetical protein ACKO4T_03230 [Planctomycetaceae bacterium]